MLRQLRSFTFRLVLACIAVLVAAPLTAYASSLVTISTNMGDIKVDLFNDASPTTVQNFLSYIGAGTYTNTIIHRSPADFVIQGGGFKTDFSAVSTNAAIPLEYKFKNARGTIAMARTGDPNSATSQWFINVGDNSTSLGPGGADQYGYAAFGWVVSGMSVVDAINNLPIYNAGSPFGELPLKDYTAPNQVTDANKIIINSITVAQQHASFQNPVFQTDVNNDGNLNSQDALVIINDLLAAGTAHNASASYITDTYKYFDPNGDGRVNSQDLLLVFNAIIAKNAAPLVAEPMAAPLVVPEPATWGMLLTAGAALGALAWRRRFCPSV
jgi:peptidyl-prolyl cis-trans isomerase A (cyclophilin A)